MSAAAMLERVVAGDRAALARAISVLERGGEAARSLAATAAGHAGRVPVVGVTGPPGAGKSTLVSCLVCALRADGHRVGVLSVDPSSPFTGGALLGDRIRLADHFLDEHVFIRSMATRGAMGGLAEAAAPALALLGAAGYDRILLETVGAGQSEIEVVHHADTVVVVLVPGTGDAVQAQKAGIMEIADVLVVNKADLAGASELTRDLRRAIALRGRSRNRIPIVQTDARAGCGIDELVAAIERQALDSVSSRY